MSLFPRNANNSIQDNGCQIWQMKKHVLKTILVVLCLHAELQRLRRVSSFPLGSCHTEASRQKLLCFCFFLSYYWTSMLTKSPEKCLECMVWTLFSPDRFRSGSRTYLRVHSTRKLHGVLTSPLRWVFPSSEATTHLTTNNGTTDIHR